MLATLASLSPLSFSGTLWTAQTLTPPSLTLMASHETCTAPSPSSFHPGSTPGRVRVLGLAPWEEASRRAPASGSWGAARPPPSPPPAPHAPSASRRTPPTANSSSRPPPRPAHQAVVAWRASSSRPGGALWRSTRVKRASRPAAGGETLLIRSLRRSRDVTERLKTKNLLQNHDEIFIMTNTQGTSIFNASHNQFLFLFSVELRKNIRFGLTEYNVEHKWRTKEGLKK